MWVAKTGRWRWAIASVLLVAGLTILSAQLPVGGEDPQESGGDANTEGQTDPHYRHRLTSQGPIPLEDPLPQDDAGSGMNAPGQCEPLNPPEVGIQPDKGFRGTIRPPLDEKDHFYFPTQGIQADSNITFQFEQNSDFPMGGIPVRHTIAILAPDCDTLGTGQPEGLFGAIELSVPFDQPYAYLVIAVTWTDSLWNNETTPATGHESGTESLSALTMEHLQEPAGVSFVQDCHDICTSYRGIVLT